MKYTQGNWTVQDSILGTSSTNTITPTIGAGERSHYARKSASENEVILTNVTGQGILAAPEIVRFGRTPVADVYKGAEIPHGAQLPTKDGVRMLVEVKERITAINSVSGAEAELPMKAWVVVQVPRSNLVTVDTINYMMNRLFGACLMNYDPDGAGFAQRFFEIAHGDLDPSTAA